MSDVRARLKDKKRIVVKIGSSSLMYADTGLLNIGKVEKLARILADLRNAGNDVCLVSSGAISTGRNSLTRNNNSNTLSFKQACAAIGQAKLIAHYQRFFAEYSINTAQVLLTEIILADEESRVNALNTFNELFKLGAIPVVNENDSISTEEIKYVHTFGDNDRLSAIVAKLVDADLLVILSDIDGMYTDDPRKNPDAELMYEIDRFTEELDSMAKGTEEGGVGTGGMATKLAAAKLATAEGIDVVILNGENPYNIRKLIEGEKIGTLFLSKDCK